MEASSTTLNINGPAVDLGVSTTDAPVFVMPSERPKRHDHGPNFGRYVANCGACEWKKAFGPKPRPSRSKNAPPPAPPASLLGKDEIIALLREHAPEMMAQFPVTPTAEPVPVNLQNDQLAQLIQLMLAKEAKTINKENEDERKKLLAREDMIRVMMETEAVVKHNQDSCRHTKENGRSALFASQVHNDGFVHPFCGRCGKVFPKHRPAQEQMSTSVEG